MAKLVPVVGLTDRQLCLVNLITPHWSTSFERLREELRPKSPLDALEWSLDLVALRDAGLIDFTKLHGPIRATRLGRQVSRAWQQPRVDEGRSH